MIPDEEGALESESVTAKKVKKLPVMEIFGPTFQGEGLMIGERTAFIRFGLCDYKCTMCDSMHAVDPASVKANAKWMTPEEIVDAVLPHISNGNYQQTAQWITFSGGNPAIHNLRELVLRIRGLDITHGNFKIAVETQGTMLPEWLHMCDVVTVSPKSPGMGEKFELNKFLEFILQFKYHKGFNVKVVVFSMADMEWATEINQLMIEEGLGDRMYFSLGNPFPPNSENEAHLIQSTHLNTNDALKLKLLDEYKILMEDFLTMPQFSNVKFLPQMHVLTYANKMGV